jgi:outer membrane immunogenic protein
MKSLMIAAASVATLATVGFAGAASAQDTATDTTVYGTVGYANVAADGDADVNLGAIQGRIGARFGKYFGVEGELATGVVEDDFDVLGTNVDVKLKHEVGVFAVGNYPITDRLDVFARVGYAWAEAKASGGGISETANLDGLAYGVGGQYFFTDKDGVRLDYTRHDGNDGEADVFGVSYVRKF